MEDAVANIEKQMSKADAKLDNLTEQMVVVERELLVEDVNGAPDAEVYNLLQTVHEVKTDYQNLRRDIVEVQEHQKQLSKLLHTQLQLLQTKFQLLRDKVTKCPRKVVQTDPRPSSSAYK